MAHRFSGGRVTWAVMLILCLTAVAPPAGAYALARWRVREAKRAVEATAALMSARKSELLELAGTAGVIAGPGRMPRGQGIASEWTQNPVSVAVSLEGLWPPDPWRRCYLLNVQALAARGSGLLISAGPNGEIETPLSASAVTGDDIGTTVR